MSGKHLYGQMWINVHLFFKPEIKPDLLPNRFQFFPPLFDYRETEMRRGGNETERETKDESRVIVSLTYGEVARRSQTVKVEGTKKGKKNQQDWMAGETEGIVRCSSFLLWVAESEGGEI